MIFYMLLLIWMIVYTVVSVPFLVFMPMYMRVCLSVVAVKVALFILRISDGIRYEVRGLHNIPETSCIVAAAHQSPLETLILMTIFKNPVYVMKKELKLFPFLGLHFILLKMIFINRRDKLQSLKSMVKLSQSRISEGRDVIIFPQGTRVNVGEKSAYKQGVFLLYHKLSVPLVPVALNTGLFWPKGLFVNKRPGKVIIEILPPIAPGLTKEELLITIQSQIEDKNRELIDMFDNNIL